MTNKRMALLAYMTGMLMMIGCSSGVIIGGNRRGGPIHPGLFVPSLYHPLHHHIGPYDPHPAWRRDWTVDHPHQDHRFFLELPSLRPFGFDHHHQQHPIRTGDKFSIGRSSTVGRSNEIVTDRRRYPYADAVYYGNPPPLTSRREDEGEDRSSSFGGGAIIKPIKASGPLRQLLRSFPDSYFDRYNLFRHEVNHLGIGLHNTRPDGHHYFRDGKEVGKEDLPHQFKQEEVDEEEERGELIVPFDHNALFRHGLSQDDDDDRRQDDGDLRILLDTSNNWTPIF